MTYATLNFYPRKDPRMRFFALWYFTILLTAWTILGDTVLGFEQSYAQPIVGVLTACAVAFFLEWLDARMNQRTPRFAGSTANVVNFLPPCIIPGLACAMLIYANSRLAPIVFAVALSLASKVLFRAPIGNGQTQHIFNPSNLGITVTLLLLPAAGLAPPYQFTENVTGLGHWLIPAVILVTGTIIHAKFTGSLPLVLAWFFGFARAGADSKNVLWHAARSPIPAHDQRRFHFVFALHDPRSCHHADQACSTDGIRAFRRDDLCGCCLSFMWYSDCSSLGAHQRHQRLEPSWVRAAQSGSCAPKAEAVEQIRIPATAEVAR